MSHTGMPTILVVDDDPDIRESLSQVLELAGYDALTAADGGEALALLGGAAPPPDLILLDLMMPGMNGFEFRERQVQRPDWAAIPVIVVTAYIQSFPGEGSLVGVECLRKPVGIAELLEAIDRALHGEPAGTVLTS